MARPIFSLRLPRRVGEGWRSEVAFDATKEGQEEILRVRDPSSQTPQKNVKGRLRRVIPLRLRAQRGAMNRAPTRFAPYPLSYPHDLVSLCRFVADSVCVFEYF